MRLRSLTLYNEEEFDEFFSNLNEKNNEKDLVLLKNNN